MKVATGRTGQFPGHWRLLSLMPVFFAMGACGTLDVDYTPVVDKRTIWIESVKRGPITLQARGLGNLRSAGRGHFRAELLVPELAGKDLQPGQAVNIDTHNGVVSGKVERFYALKNSLIHVDVSLPADLPKGARNDLPVDGTIDLGRHLDNVLYIGRPALGQAESTVSLFKFDKDGKFATRVQVKLGKSSATTIEVLNGLQEGDQIILSDMSRYDDVDKIRVD